MNGDQLIDFFRCFELSWAITCYSEHWPWSNHTKYETTNPWKSYDYQNYVKHNVHPRNLKCTMTSWVHFFFKIIKKFLSSMEMIVFFAFYIYFGFHFNFQVLKTETQTVSDSISILFRCVGAPHFFVAVAFFLTKSKQFSSTMRNQKMGNVESFS